MYDALVVPDCTPIRFPAKSSMELISELFGKHEQSSVEKMTNAKNFFMS